MRRLDRLPASAFRRATRAESAKLGVPYSAKRYLPNTIKRVTASTRTLSEREHRTIREGVTVETAIAERKRGVRPYQSPASHIRAQRAIERNRRDPIRAHVREKKAAGRRITEREFVKANEWYLDIVEKKSGIRWRLVNGEWRSDDTGREPQALSQDEFERAVAFYRANEDFYRTTEDDLFQYRGNGPSPGVSRKTFNRGRRAGYGKGRSDRTRAA
jgi:hypothetical protein